VGGLLAGREVRLFPVGRLDRDVSGLLILTNDGELAKRLMHPSRMVPKVYRVLVEGDPDGAFLRLLSSGRLIVEGRPAAPAEARLVRSGPDRGWVELVLTEGRNRQVKRMCAAAGRPVVRLKRIAYCGLPLPPDLPPGAMRPLTASQVRVLKAAVGLAGPESAPETDPETDQETARETDPETGRGFDSGADPDQDPRPGPDAGPRPDPAPRGPRRRTAR
jgi:pseudouridine synthase